MNDETELLRAAPHFLGLSPSEFDLVRKLGFSKTYQCGEIILLEGESNNVLYFIKSGAVKIFKTSADGREQILNIVRPGESFNDVQVFGSGPNPISAQAIAPVVLYGILKDDMYHVLRDQPQISLNVINVLAGRLRRLLSLVADLSFKQVINRVAKILLEHAGDGKEGNQKLAQREMASMAGTVREVLGRTLQDLEARNLIKIDRHRIIIKDEEGLKNIAGVST